MEIIIYLIPILVSLGLLLFVAKKVVWWEYFLLIGGSVLLTFLLKQGIIAVKTSDTEYWSGYITQTTYYEPWNEEVEVTKTRTNSDGKEETYTETETRYHSEEYTYRTNLSRSESWCNKKFHEELKKQFQVHGVFRDMHRNYDTQDGDAYDYIWPGDDRTMRTITEEHLYKNPLKGSSSIFRLSRTDSNLFDYPGIVEKEQRVVLGNAKYNPRPIQLLNSKLGKDYQIHIFILLFYNSSSEIAERQKEYWEGGNKNELVICLGMKNDSVVWCNPFSWCDRPVVESNIKSWFLENPKLNLESFSTYLGPEIKKNWDRKEFKDFDYIQTELGGWDYVIILVLVLIYIGLISTWILRNDFENVD
jgi:hypothetical protein